MPRGTWQGGGTWQTSGGGGGLLLAVIAAAVLIGSGAASAAVSALVTIVIVVGCVIGAAMLGGVALLVYRARQRPREIRTYRSDLEGAPALKLRTGVRNSAPEIRHAGADLRAIEAPRNELHLHFHGMSAAEAAEAIRQASEGG